MPIQNLLPARRRSNAARRDENERRRALIEGVVVELVEDVVDEHLPLASSCDLAFEEGVETPIVGKHGALVRGQQRSAVDFRPIGRLPADLDDRR